MVSRVLSADKDTVLQAPTIPGYSSGGGSTQEIGGKTFTGIEDPQALAMLMQTLTQLAGGGTAEMKRQRAERNTEISRTRSLSGDYSKNAAFQDAADLMAQNLRLSMEANMPAINKAVENSGSSGSAMQALLSQKLATESSQAAGALGAQQAQVYGNIAANLQEVLEALTRGDNSQLEALLKGLDLSKVTRQTNYGTQTTNPRTEVGQSGGGTFIAGQQGSGGVGGGSSQYQDGVWYGPPTSGSSAYVPVGTPRSFYPNGQLPPAAPYGGASSGSGSGSSQGMTVQDLYAQANQSNAWATGSKNSDFSGWGYGD